jgi:hypothetical protein
MSVSMAEQKEMINKCFVVEQSELQKSFSVLHRHYFKKTCSRKEAMIIFIPLFRPWAIIKHFLSLSLSFQA